MKDEHSLHVTVSTYQRNTWGDYLQKVRTASNVAGCLLPVCRSCYFIRLVPNKWTVCVCVCVCACVCVFVQLLTVALSSAHEDDITFREGLPLSYLSYTGMANLDSVSWRDSHVLACCVELGACLS